MALKLYSRHYFVTETATYKVQRGITKKIYKKIILLVLCISSNGVLIFL